MGTHLFHADTLESVISMQAMRLLEEKYSSLFFNQNDLLIAEYVLDVICGSGTWALDVGLKYPHVQVIGIDSRPAMIRYAQAQGWFYQCHNVDFQLVDDPLRLTQFPRASFDIVNAFLSFECMHRNDWPRLVREGFRVLRPRGLLCIVEIDGWNLCEAPATSRLLHIFHQVIWKAGRSFSQEGGGLGITAKVNRLLHQEGFEDVTLSPLILDGSYGTDIHSLLLECFVVLALGFKPLLLTVLSEEEFQQLYAGALHEMHQESFGGLCYCTYLSGRRPAG